MQIQIMYSDADEQIAQTIQQDMAAAGLRLDHHVIVIVLSPAAASDSTLKQEISSVQSDDTIFVPVIVNQTPVPAYLRDHQTLDLSKSYDSTKLVKFIKQADITAEQRRNNRRLLFIVGGIALVMFSISLWSISSGIVAFPVDEYATENAIRDAQIATIVAPQIEELRPRTTEDALNFASTLEAVRNEDLLPFIQGTATAIPEQRAATEQARQTQVAATQSAGD